MYSWEIDKLIKEYNNIIPASLYLNILDTSPQICRVLNNTWEGLIYLDTSDNYHWSIAVYPD